MHGLSHYLPVRRFCGNPDRRRPLIPFCGHRPHPQGGLRQTAPARQTTQEAARPRAHEFVCAQWEINPANSVRDPTQLILGLYTNRIYTAEILKMAPERLESLWTAFFQLKRDPKKQPSYAGIRVEISTALSPN